MCNVSISFQRLSVEAAVTGDNQLLRQAMMMDPLVGVVCKPKEYKGTARLKVRSVEEMSK